MAGKPFISIDKVIIYLVLAIMVLALFLYLRNCNAGTGGKSDIPQPLDTIHSVNKAGDSVISLKGAPVDFTQIEKHLADSIAKVYNTKVKDLQEVIIAQTRTITELSATGPVQVDFTTDTVHPDCPPIVTRMRQTFTNPYYTARVQVGDSAYLHLTAYDTITALWKRVKEGNIFNRKTYLQLDISHANPDTKVTGLLAYRVEDPRPKKFGIGLSAGVTWNGKWAPYAGIGLNYNLIRF